MEPNDKYRRDSLDGGTTWKEPYQFRGTDGSNADVPTYIHSNYIGPTEIHSPTIKANDYYIYPNDENDIDGTFNIYGMFDGIQYHMFQIAYYGGIPPTIRLSSPDDGDVHIGKTVKGKTFIEGQLLDLQGLTKIEWGKNAPNAIWAD